MKAFKSYIFFNIPTKSLFNIEISHKKIPQYAFTK